MHSVPFVFEEWCGWSESNRQRGNPQRILSPPRMPISPQPHRVYTRRNQNSMHKNKSIQHPSVTAVTASCDRLGYSPFQALWLPTLLPYSMHSSPGRRRTSRRESPFLARQKRNSSAAPKLTVRNSTAAPFRVHFSC